MSAYGTKQTSKLLGTRLIHRALPRSFCRGCHTNRQAQKVPRLQTVLAYDQQLCSLSVGVKPGRGGSVAASLYS